MSLRIDLRSDTVTRPSTGMLAAMGRAETGDDVYGEDPTVIALEERVAQMFGHAAGLFTVSGSLANLLGVRAHVTPGQELLCEAGAHVVRAEMGSHATGAGVTTRTWSHPRGAVDLAAISRLMAPDAGPYLVSTAAISVENTHNFGGGTTQSLDVLRDLRALVAGTGIALHLDGARWWNAQVATGTPAAAMGEIFDSVSVCLSKGLGAPVGSVLVGSAEVIAQARTWRKRWGGGWRQAGVLAAAGLYALDHQVDSLADDHDNAARLAEIVADAVPGVVDPAAVETNIVVMDTSGLSLDPADVVAAAADRGVAISAVGPQLVRALTHRDVSRPEVETAAAVLAEVLASRST